MEPFARPRKTRLGWLKALPLGLLLLLLGRGAGAQEDAFVNTGTLDNYAPNIYATNFLNDTSATFSWNLGISGSWLESLYQSWFYTLNFTNAGEMDSTTGFRFDSQIPNVSGHTEAASVYNAGNIYCGALENAVFITQFSIGSTFYGGYGGFYVNATNFFNSGTVTIGQDGLALIYGDNLDFSRGTLLIQGSAESDGANINASGAVDASTNQWSPAGALGEDFAYGPMNKTPFELYLFDSVPYFNIQTDSTGSNVVVRMIFLQDQSVNVATNVYFDDFTGDGFGHVEWVGSYTDPLTGQAANRYLYLDDDFEAGASTNLLKFGDPGSGIPGNYDIYASDTEVDLGTPATNGFVFNLLNSGNVSSNIYSYVSAQFIPTDISTNGLTGTIALTNLPGRVVLSAAQSLGLSLSSVSGMNYLQLNSTNEFDTDGQSTFASPFSDFYLGHTNGSFVVANLIQSSLPLWSGTLQAWNTRWFYTQTNAGPGGTNAINYDFRVLLVYSRLNPSTATSVQDFVLNSTNNVVISDTLNITRTLSLNCTNLLVTTNGIGNGFASPEGALNLSSSTFSWAASVPDLLCLTNDGAITYLTPARFVGSASVVTVTPGTNAVAAVGTLAEVATNANVKAHNTVTIGTNVYAFVGTLTNKTPNQVAIGSKFDGSMSNLIAAINHAAGAGVAYSTNTAANPLVSAGALVNHAFTVTALIAGAAGNAVTTTNSAATTNLTWNGHATLQGGADAVAPVTNVSPVAVPYDDFVNAGVISGLDATIWSDDFENYGYISAGSGLFSVQSLTTTMTNGTVIAAGTVSLTADSMVIAGTSIQAGKSLTLIATNLLTDTGVTNGNTWLLGTNYPGYGSWIGLVLPVKPKYGDLLGTTITNVAVTNTLISETWAGEDRGAVNAGFSNNAAVGQMIFDAQGPTPRSQFYFTGVGASNGLYVDNLVLLDQATNQDGSFNLLAFNINTNLVIYFAQATLSGVSVAEKLDGKNVDAYGKAHLRWVPTYAGHFSSTNLVYPPGVTNTVNAALAQSADIDSNGNGSPNLTDPEPFLVPAQVNFTETLTNVPPLSVRLQWVTVANGTNFVYYTTNLASADWLLLTNFVSPLPYPSPPGPVSVLDPLTNTARYYQVVVEPDLLYGEQ